MTSRHFGHLQELRDPPEHLERQLQASRRWYETSGAEGQRCYLAYEKYEGLDLSGAVIVEATLQEAGLEASRLDGVLAMRVLGNGLSLKGSSLIGANFYKADLAESDLTGALAREAIFQKTTLTQARLDGTDLRKADLQGATCLSTSFTNADVREANLAGATLTGADFASAHLQGAILTGAVIGQDTSFINSIGLEEAVAETVVIGDQLLSGGAALSALQALGRSH
jgi:uncharacterized protein YjbI with pentapeptide repeats